MNLDGTKPIKENWDDLNVGFDNTEAELDAAAAVSEGIQAEVTEHKDSTAAHAAEHITYAGTVVGAENIEQAIDFVDERVSTIIAGGGEGKDPELTDIKTPDPGYTPGREIVVAGDMVRDMQHQFSAQLADIALNIRSFGAALDGVSDDTQAWIDAHDALPAGGGKILVPVSAGTKITSHLFFTKPVVIEGNLSPTLSSSIGSIIILSGSGELTLSGDGSGASNINIYGAPGNTGNGINFTGGRPWTVNLLVTNQGNDGVVFGSESATTNVNNFNIINLKSKSNGRNGVLIASNNSVLPDTNAGSAYGIDVAGNGGDGLKLLNAYSNTFVGVHSERNAGNNLSLYGSGANTFLNPYLESAGMSTNEIYIDSTSVENKILGMPNNHFATNLVVNLGARNIIWSTERNKGLFNFLSGEMIFEVDGVSAHGVTGYWRRSQNVSNGNYEITRSGTSTNGDIDFTQSTGIVRLLMDKIIVGYGTTGASAIVKNVYVIGTRDFGTINANSTKDLTITANGASVGDFVQVSRLTAIDAGLTLTGFVSAANTITIRMSNSTAANITTVSDSYRCLATRAE
ncbi:hypothetical protein [Paenibacillus sp. PastH-2]|uniref:hypothetical protein n=2 Tax=Paenibacillus TaxID=44249 RepID=UPI0024762DFF|nr:hypothetical protein [Paenibacillus sp. PastH-2]